MRLPWILLILFVFFALRLIALAVVPPTFDEMVGLTMAEDIAWGRRFPLYFYGQQYMGPIECYALVPFLRVFGSSVWVGRFFGVLIYGAFAGGFLWSLRRVHGSRLMFLVGILLAVPPFPVLYFTTVFGYGEILTLAALSLMFLVDIASQKGPARMRAFLLGVVSGLAFWCNPISLVWAPSMALCVFWIVPATWKRKLPLFFFVGLMAGLFPVWMHGIQTGIFLSLPGDNAGFARKEDILGILYLFFARMKYFLSTFVISPLGPWETVVLRGASWIPLGSFGICLLGELWSLRRAWHQKKPQERVLDVFVLLPVFVLIPLYGLRNLGADEGIRFYLPLLFSFTYCLARQIQRIKHARAQFLATGIMAFFFLVVSILALREEQRQLEGLRQITRFLRQEHLEFGIADMDIAYTLNALGGGKIHVTPVLHNARCKELWSLVREKGPRFWITDRSNAWEAKWGKGLIRKVVMGRHDIYYGSPAQFQAILQRRN